MKYKILVTCLLSFSSTLLQAGDAVKGGSISGACATCHGPSGVSDNDLYPSIAGQKEAYLVKVLKDYQAGKRMDVNMQAQVGPLTAQNIEDLAAYFAGNAVILGRSPVDTSISVYSPETKSLLIPTVKVLNDLYRVEMLQKSDTQFEIKSIDKLP
jgi:cytochrome c553